MARNRSSSGKNLTQGQVKALQLLRAKLDTTNPAFRGSVEVRDALGNAPVRPYIEAWVLTLVDFVLGDGYSGQEYVVDREHLQMVKDTATRADGDRPSGLPY